MYLCDVLTVTCNLAGLPGISVPCGFSARGLPIGFQILGRPFDEWSLFRVAGTLERTLQIRERKPPLDKKA
jgi:aspartyl-tRNA(Asn)/glutamyl-tRNA(Gln) amidotransferase subunit A